MRRIKSLFKWMGKGGGKGKDGKARRRKGTGAFDILKYIEETQVSVEVIKDVITKPFTKAEFELTAITDPAVKKRHGPI